MTLLMGTRIFKGVGILSAIYNDWGRRIDVLNMVVWASLGYLGAVMVITFPRSIFNLIHRIYIYHPLSITQYYLSHGLLASIIHKQLPVARFLLSRGATITPSVAMATVRGECVPVVKLLVQHRWDFNISVMGG